MLYTIGHSNHSLEKLIQLLNQHQISAIADVRSQPYSRMNPQFNREQIKVALNASGVAYAFLGRELGARTDDRSCYVDGKVQYELLANNALFRKGLARITAGVRKHRVALMCAEKDPITCHRMILICHEYRRSPIPINHICANGTLESNADAEKRLVKVTGLPEVDLFSSIDEIIEEAYRRQEKRIAWAETDGESVDEFSPLKAESSR